MNKKESITLVISAILWCRDPQLSAVDKFFLIAAVIKYGNDVIGERVKDLSESLRLHESFVPKARNVWAEKGVVRMVPGVANQAQRGRRRKAFRIDTDELVAAYENDKQEGIATANVVNAGMLTMLFCGLEQRERVRVKRKEFGSQLTVNNVVLLGVLVMVADRTGCIFGHGSQSLRTMAGLKKSQFQYALNSLASLGVLRNWLPGITGRHLFGKKPGVYWLNLDHAVFEGSRVNSIHILDRTTRGELSSIDVLYAQFRKYEIATECARGRSKVINRQRAEYEQMYELPYGGHQFFLDSAWSRAQQHLKCLVARYACVLLEIAVEKWGTVDADSENACSMLESASADLMTSIEKSMGSGTWRKKLHTWLETGDTDKDSEELLSEMASFLAYRSFRLASAAMAACKEGLSKYELSHVLTAGTKFQIYPNHDANGPYSGLSLGIWPGDPDVLSASVLITKPATTKEIDWERFDDERGIEPVILYEMGLRKQP